MPYSQNAELPEGVRRLLPDHAQEIFRNAFNSSIKRGLSEARAFASAYGAIENAGYKRGEDGKYHRVAKTEAERLAEYSKQGKDQAAAVSGKIEAPTGEFTLEAEITKLDDEKQLAFGWASIVIDKKGVVSDAQGDQISEAEIEDAAYRFVLRKRKAGEMHEVIGVGQLVESMVFSREKQKTLGVDLEKSGWWVGFKVDDPDTWKKIKSGKLQAFSIGGKGKRVSM